MSLAKFLLPPFFCAVSSLGLALIGMPTHQANAEEYQPSTPYYHGASSNLMGSLGLNIIPNARMDDVGVVRIGAGTSDPYGHGFIGFQVAERLNVNFRQTGEFSSLLDTPSRLYPAIDFKLRLSEETATKPEVVIGMNSVTGHKRTASEYIAFSKRKNNFDFTAGMAWGRLSGKGHIKNPLAAVSSHFETDRNFNNHSANGIDDWFTGDEIGFFGGVEYYTPMRGLSLKLDYAPYDDAPEVFSDANYDAPAPWGASVNYKPWNQTDISVGTIGGEKFMARLSFQDNLKKWIGRGAPASESPPLEFPRAEGNESAYNKTLDLKDYKTTPLQIAHQARVVSASLPNDAEAIEFDLRHKGLKGPKVRLIRRDLEEAIIHNHGSPEEIWQDVAFLPNKSKSFNIAKYFKDKKFLKSESKLILNNQISLSEEDEGVVFRSSLMHDYQKPLPLGLRLGLLSRFEIANNLESLRQFRTVNSNKNSVRSNEDQFASKRFGIDQLYLSWLHSVSDDLHVTAMAGYLEEMFAGYGGEVLYRPFGKRFAVGAEGWQVRKRVPLSLSDYDLEEDDIFTGHVNAFYEMPNETTTLFTKVGQYLDEDIGATFGVSNRFNNGTKLDGFVSATNARDKDIFGGEKSVYAGMQFTMPIGNITKFFSGSEVRVKTAPFARDKGQILDRPNPLYEVTEPIAYRHLSRNWPDLLR